MTIPFNAFPKIPRLKRDIVITEKIDGTNASICITPEGEFLVGSRTRWITPEDDNYGFARWAKEHEEELRQLGPGHHFGEWFGSKINRSYGYVDGTRRFALFNVGRWSGGQPERTPPACTTTVPVLYHGPFTDTAIDLTLHKLATEGSTMVPGFMKPEGIVVYHKASNSLFKRTLEKDEQAKGQQ